MTESISNKPAHTLRISPVKATIWKNPGQNGTTFYSVNFARTYRDSEGNFQDSTSYSGDELLVLAKLADQAHTWITEQRSLET